MNVSTVIKGHDRAITGRPRVVIVGSGFGGLFAAQALRRSTSR